MVNQLTIQRHRKPGQALLHAMFRRVPSKLSLLRSSAYSAPNSAVKVRSHVMYTDTSHNSLATVYTNIYRSMLVVALKFQAYVQEWGTDPRRKTGFLYSAWDSPDRGRKGAKTGGYGAEVIQQVVNFQWADIVSKSRSRKAQALKVELGLKRLWIVWSVR